MSDAKPTNDGDEAKPKVGRPLAPIDEEQVRKLARLGCTNGEIGDWFGCSGETVRTRFLDVLRQARAEQKMSLRRLQWKSALEGSVPMLIHLGKHVLGQGDKVANEHRFGFGHLTHEEALLELEGESDLDEAKARLLRSLPVVTVNFVGGEPGSLAADRPEPTEADARAIDDE